MVGPNRSKRAEILRDVSVNTVASARCVARRHEMEAVSTALFGFERHTAKTVQHSRVYHRAEATVLMPLLYRGSQLFGTWDSMPLSYQFAFSSEHENAKIRCSLRLAKL